MIPLTDLVLLLTRKAQYILKWRPLDQALQQLERWPIEQREPSMQWNLTPSESLPHRPLKVLAFENSTLVVHSGIVLHKGSVVSASLKIPSSRMASYEFHRKGIKCLNLACPVASMDMVWSSNYYHMLQDGLFALHALKAVPADVPLTVVTRLKLPAVMLAAYREWLPSRPLIQLENTARVSSPLVVVPPRLEKVHFNGESIGGLASLPNPIHAFTRRYGKGCKLPESLRRAPRLFIGRSGAKWRRLLNETEVLKLLESRGFLSIPIHMFTNEQQFELFRRAEAIIAVRGASVANLLAIERPLRFISLRPTTDGEGKEILESYVKLGAIAYGEVCGDRQGGNSDFRIEISKLEAELDRLGLH